MDTLKYLNKVLVFANMTLYIPVHHST